MEYIIITVKDNAVEAFQPVSNVRAKGEAIRSFIDAINNPQNKQLHDHPEDFDLYTVGTYDDQTGNITPHTPERLMRGTDAKRST